MDASIELKDSIVSCSSGLMLAGPINSVIGNFILVDMNQDEERNCKGNLILVYAPNKKKINYLDLKNSKMQHEHLEELLALAEQGCKQIAEAMRKQLLHHYVSKLVTSH